MRRPTARQHNSLRRGGILNGFSNGQHDDLRMKPFRQELQALGWIEGRTVSVDYHQVTDPSRSDATARELVSAQPDVILVVPTPAMQAIWRATRLGLRWRRGSRFSSECSQPFRCVTCGREQSVDRRAPVVLWIICWAHNRQGCNELFLGVQNRSCRGPHAGRQIGIEFDMSLLANFRCDMANI
ncbi:MAG: hypothetical protein QOK44_1976 [Betaproteobacteria bacterium]|nr:hypothetical protein [Betaproteobacteria bacterium]